MTGIQNVDDSSDKPVRRNFMSAPRAAHEVASKSRLYLVPKTQVPLPVRRKTGERRITARRSRRAKIADGMFVALAVGGAAAVWWGLW